MPGVAGFGVRAENLAGVIGGDLILVTVGRNDSDVEPPLFRAGRIIGLLTEHAHPGGPFPDRGVGEFADVGADQRDGVVQVADQRRVSPGGRPLVPMAADTGQSRPPGQSAPREKTKQVGRRGTARPATQGPR